MVESVVVITDQSPVGKNSAAEAIRIGSGFVALGEIIDCQIVDSLSETIEIADLSDLELCVLDSALEDAGLTNEDLIEYENLKIINIDELSDLIEKADVSFRF
ncbi:MAG: hypothetical protein ACTSQD_08360 [Promethearchaeota archaeon]